MSEQTRQQRCGSCGKWVNLPATSCTFCGMELGVATAPPVQRPPPGAPVDATGFLIPTNVSGWAMASCYLGLVSFCLPVVGLVFSIPAVIFGVIAISKPRKATSYGGVTSNIRAIIGLVAGGLATLIWGGAALVLLLDK